MAGKADIVDAIVNDTGLTRKDAAAALDSVVNAITGNLKKGERVAIPGLGVFHVADRKARAGINPRTKATIRIAAAKVARFRAGKDLKDLLNKRRR
jgi:nucleoid DNA-binding protein